MRRRAPAQVVGLLVAGMLTAAFHSTARAQGPLTAPHDGYWLCFEPYYEGNYREALSAFGEAAKTRIITTAQTPWIDSICFHTMLGECSWQLGDHAAALEQYNAALNLFLQNSHWLLRIDFSQEIGPDPNVQSLATWGPSSRRAVIGKFPRTFQSFRGRLDNQNVLRTGGVVEPPQFHPVVVTEIVRCTAVAIARRRLILGPASEHDPLTGQVLTALVRRPGPPNHWSQSWIELQLGLAYAAANQVPQAVNELRKSLLVAGQYDHPLTALGLLELGRLAFEQGQYDAAITYFHEATISGAAFRRYDVMEEAFRLGAEAHLLAGKAGVYPPLVPAIAALGRESRALAVALHTALAEQLCTAGEKVPAAAALAQARSHLPRRGPGLGAAAARLNFQTARVALQSGDTKAGLAALAAALAYQKSGSLWLFQIGLIDGLYRSGSVTERVADLLYAHVLREPTRADWALDPLEALAVGMTPHPQAYEHWLEVAFRRKEAEKALEIAERLRRHRFFCAEPSGGRVLALRWILEAPAERLSPAALVQRQDLLVRFPAYAELSRRAAEIKPQLQALPLVPVSEADARRQSELLAELGRTSAAQESWLQRMALERVPSELVFPPLLETREIQQRLPAGTLVFCFLFTSSHLHGFALSRERLGYFSLPQPARLKSDVADLLRQMGNGDRNQPILVDELAPSGWKPIAERLLSQFTSGTPSADWDRYRELVIVPDGVLWYVPFELLGTPGGPPLVQQMAVRYAPTLGLALPERRGPRPQGRTAVVSGKLLARDDEAAASAAAAAVSGALPGSVVLSGEPRAPAALWTASLDRLIVMRSLDDADKLPFGWAPLGLDAGKPGSTLAEWGQLPFGTLEQLVLPGFHTPAEFALKRGGTGDELFLATCGLMATGCRTVLLSRWRVGGQSTVDLMREFVQELPHEPPAAAWRRSIELASRRTLDPAQEGRLRTSGTAAIRADHPFFWAGYLLVDGGLAGEEPGSSAPGPNNR